MVEIIDSRDKWPFPRAVQLRQAGAEDWLEISQAHSDQLLGAVPPIFVPHGFYVGEEADFDRRGPIHALVLTYSGRNFLREVNLRKDAREHAQLQLLQALHPGAAPEGSTA